MLRALVRHRNLNRAHARLVDNVVLDHGLGDENGAAVVRAHGNLLGHLAPLRWRWLPNWRVHSCRLVVGNRLCVLHAHARRDLATARSGSGLRLGLR